MSRPLAGLGVFIVVLGVDSGGRGSAQAVTPLRAQPIAASQDTTEVVQALTPPDQPDRIFMVERDGLILLRRPDGTFTPFLDVAAILNPRPGPEDGLLSMAFHPDYSSNGEFFIFYTDVNGGLVIARFHVSANPDVAATQRETVLLIDREPLARGHNGGWMAFGPDGHLYLTTGDGDLLNPQDITDNLLGKLLRINVDGDDFPLDANKNYAIPAENPLVGVEGDDEILAFGLRNPWRCSIDSLTGDLYLGDVGDSTLEEINLASTTAMTVLNFGWPCMEGTLCGVAPEQCDCGSPDLTPPIFEYGRSGTSPAGCAVIGGEVYRGSAIPDLQGTYFFADFCSGEVWSFGYDGSVGGLTNRTAQLFDCVNPGQDPDFAGAWSFGRNSDGEVFIATGFDGVHKIVADVPRPILDSTPPGHAVDARRPVQGFGDSLFSDLADVMIEFDGCALCHSTDTFRIEQVGGLVAPPQESKRFYRSKQCETIDVELDRGLEIGAWTVIVHEQTGSSTRIGALPADVNADGASDAADLMALSDALRGIGTAPAYWSTDLNRSDASTPADLLEAVDLLMGYGGFRPFLGATLP